MNSTTQTVKKEKKILKKVNSELKNARRVAVVGASPAVTGAVSRAEKAVRRRGALKTTHLAAWAQALSDPFESEGAICPVNFNVAPSLMKTTARLTHTALSLQVPASVSRQMLFFPGHGAAPRSLQLTGGNAIISQIDPTSFHYCGDYSNLLGTDRNIAPINTVNSGSSPATAIGCLAAAVELTYGQCSNLTPHSPMPFDNVLPYVGSAPALSGSHLRWQLVSCGVRIFNTTPQLYRGGNIVSVQFVNGSGLITTTGANATQQSQLDSNPTFRIHGDGSDGVQISWIPRLEDLAYWHHLTDTVPNENTRPPNWAAAAMAIFLNNPTSTPQTYTVQCVWNVMLAGTGIQSISTPAVVEPSIKGSIEQTVVHLQNTASTAATAPLVAEASLRGDDGTSMFERLGNRAYQAAMDAAHSVTAGAVHGLMSSSYGHGRYGGPLAPRIH